MSDGTTPWDANGLWAAQHEKYCAEHRLDSTDLMPLERAELLFYMVARSVRALQEVADLPDAPSDEVEWVMRGGDASLSST